MLDVSILLLTRNGAATLPRLLDALAAQSYDGSADIVAVDSGSTDGSAEMLRRRARTFLAIDPAEFNHGETRNLGIDAATTPLVVLIVQDAIPVGRSWLRELVRPLHDDGRVAAAWSRQVPNSDASPVTRMHLAQWLGALPEPRVSSIGGAEEFERLRPWERFERCALDNVCACIRRSAWERHPFRRVPIGEDIEWARDVLLDGYRVAYAPASIVQHSHERSARYEFLRTMLIHYRLRTLFGLSTVPGVWPLARSIASSARAHSVSVRAGQPAERSLRAWSRAMALSVAWPLGQYTGARLADWGVRMNGFRGI